VCPTWRGKGGFIGISAFRAAIEYMLEQKMIGPDSRIGLFNWGEPMLHPQFDDIIEFMSITGMKFSLSTNGSMLRIFKKPAILSNLCPMKFSMCGFSQASYDRIQGLSFEIAKQNIAAMTANYRDCGFVGPAYLLFHVYQFNLHEMDAAREFASSIGLTFFPYYAHLNHVPATIDYLNGKTSRDILYWMQDNMVLSHVPALITNKPDYWECPEHGRLVIDEQLNVRTCCVVPPHDPEYHLGNLLDMTEEEIQAKRMQPICHECLRTGAAYWLYPDTKPKPEEVKR